MKQYVKTLQQHLEWAFEIAREHIEKEVGHQKLYYDRRVHCMDIIPGHIVLVRQKCIWNSAQDFKTDCESPKSSLR